MKFKYAKLLKGLLNLMNLFSKFEDKNYEAGRKIFKKIID